MSVVLEKIQKFFKIFSIFIISFIDRPVFMAYIAGFSAGASTAIVGRAKTSWAVAHHL
jgi:hypothetical protein